MRWKKRLARQVCNHFFHSFSKHLHKLGLVHQHSSWRTKGRAPALPDVDVSGTNTGRSKKCVADDLKNVVPTISTDDDGNYNDDMEMDNPTPKKKGKGKATFLTTNFEVLIDSPPNRRPTQRLQMNEAGDAIDASTMTREEAENWVVTGKVCPNHPLIILVLSLVEM